MDRGNLILDPDPFWIDEYGRHWPSLEEFKSNPEIKKGTEMISTKQENYWTDEEARSIVDTMVKQIGNNALGCVAAHTMVFGQWRGPGKVTLQMRTRNCGSKGRRVEVTYDHGNDLYIVEGVDVRKKRNLPSYERKVRYSADRVFAEDLGDFVILAADFKP